MTSKGKKTSERVFLDESRFNSPRFKTPLKTAPSFLLEFDKDTKTKLTRIKNNPDIPIYMNGPIQAWDIINRNRRKYPKEYLLPECERYINEEIADKQAFGELDHPESSTSPSLKNSSHIIEDIWFKDNHVYGRVKILNAFAGESDPAYKVRNIILNEQTVGISSRSLGSLIEYDDYDEVCEDLTIICWDLVSRQSTHKAILVHESQSNKKSYLKESLMPTQRNGIQQLTDIEKTTLQILGFDEFCKIYKKY